MTNTTSATGRTQVSPRMAEAGPFDTTGPSTIGAGLAKQQKTSAAMTRWVDKRIAATGRNPGTLPPLARTPEAARHLPDFGKGRAG